jgi:hypothetical protein
MIPIILLLLVTTSYQSHYGKICHRLHIGDDGTRAVFDVCDSGTHEIGHAGYNPGACEDRWRDPVTGEGMQKVIPCPEWLPDPNGDLRELP